MMKYGLIILALFLSVSGCKKSNPKQDVCNMAYYTDERNLKEVLEEEPELIPIPVDTTSIKGNWILTSIRSSYYNLRPTDTHNYILKLSSGGMEIEFCANRLLAEYYLVGDTLKIGTSLWTKAKGPDEPIEAALSDLFSAKDIRVDLYRFAGIYLTITGYDNINGNLFADFRREK